MSGLRSYTSNNTNKATTTDRQNPCLSSRKDRQFEYRCKDTGSQLLSSEQPTLRDPTICILLMDRSADETGTRKSQTVNSNIPVRHEDADSCATPTSNASHNDFVRTPGHTDGLPICNAYRTRYGRQVKPRVILDL